EAGGKLREQGAELAGGRERIDRGAEFVDVLRPEVQRIGAGRLLEHLGVRELLKEFERELEVGRRALRPAGGRRGRRHAIERRVDLDGVEVVRVEAEFVELAASTRTTSCRRVEDPVPGPFTRWVAPAGRPDADVGLTSCTSLCRSQTLPSIRGRGSAV